MANDGQIVFEVTADGKHAIADIKEITRAIQQETSKWDDAAGQSTNNISNQFSGMLKKLTAGFSAVKIGKALLDLGQDALAAASDLEEVQNVVDVTFGSDANKIDKWAKSAGAQFGLTETQAKKFTSTLGAMMKSAGMSGGEIADMSTNLAGLAADMASFYNLDFDTAFQKIRSGISGETEPLKQLGINMSVANLNAYALQQGLSKTFEEMDQGEQTMLRYQYLMQATSDAQGDFSRTSDGYANSVRKLQTNVDQLKTTLGKSFIDVVTEATNFINTFIEKLTPAEKSKTVLDDFAEIDLNTETKLAQIAEIKAQADTLTQVLDDLFGTKDENGNVTGGKDITDTLSKLGVTSDAATAYLEGLGLGTDEITKKQDTWLETCRQLVKTIPGLNSIINTETGEITGGTQAVEDYVKAWEEGQRKLALLGAVEQKQSALDKKFEELPLLEVDKLVAERRVRQSREQLDKLYEKYGLTAYEGSNGKILRQYRNARGLSAEDKALLEQETDYYEQLYKEMQEATAEYDKQYAAYLEAKAAIEESRKTVNEMPGDIKQATEATTSFWEENADNIKTVVQYAEEATKALGDYVQGVQDSMLEAVNSTVKSLDSVDYQSYGNEIEKISKLVEEQSKYKVGSDKWKELQTQIEAANESLISTNSIMSNLESQEQFLDSYLANLKKAREMGLSDALLAELSDGTTESAEYLDALVNDKTGVSAKEIDEKYQTIQEKKAALSTELANQQLTVDQTYQSLAEKAKEAVAALDLQGEASTNTGKTLDAIVSEIADHVPDVATQVDSILSELSRLNGYGIHLDFGGFGSIDFTTSTGENAEGSGRMGLDFIPHDGYLARLHEGERVLTAQENQIWNVLRNGGIAGFDLEDLGGVMRDNVKAGGNVYLDGRAVGSVISDQQAKSYRQLQRSGWQG